HGACSSRVDQATGRLCASERAGGRAKVAPERRQSDDKATGFALWRAHEDKEMNMSATSAPAAAVEPAHSAPSPRPFGLPSDNGGKDFGLFLPMANGGWILSSTAPRLDGSYAYNREATLLAERHGLDFVMAMAKWRG